MPTPVPVRTRILEAVQTALAAIPGIVAVDRDREDDLGVDDCPRINVIEGEEGEAEAMYCGEDVLRLSIDVEGYVVGDQDDAASAAAAQLRALVDQVFLTGGGNPFGGLVRLVERSSEPNNPALNVNNSETARAFVRGFQLIYATRIGDPFTPA
jgi:hypothetical protein